MMDFFESLCRLCKYRKGFGCDAYPDGIPLDIRLMYVDHRRPYEGDHGILFESKDDSEETRRRLSQVRVRRKPNWEKLRAVTARVRAVRSELAVLLRERGEVGDQIESELMRRLRRAEEFEDLPADCRDVVLEAERRHER